jgi:hypothetical protein
MRQRIVLSADDIIRHQSIAFHAVTIAYESILRKQAMNVKYQAEGVLNRVAGMCKYNASFLFHFVQTFLNYKYLNESRCRHYIVLSPVIRNTMDAVNCLSKMDVGNKIRCTWLLCLLYVLQEAPEVSIRSSILSLCDKSKVRKQSYNSQ